MATNSELKPSAENFKSVIGGRVDWRVGPPCLTLRRTQSGATGGILSKATGLLETVVDLQVDIKSGWLRVKAAEKGFKVQRNGSFSCSAIAFKSVSADDKKTVKIQLKLDQDGWWYGRFSEAHHEE
ncbi:hypothetical protein [Serratia fonticola]